MPKSSIEWMLEMADRGPIEAQSDVDLVRREMAHFFEMSQDAGLAERDVKKSYTFIKSGIDRLRRGAPWTILGQTFYLDRERGLTSTSPPGERYLQERVLKVLKYEGNLLGRCKRKGCRNIFLKRPRQKKYCTATCSGLARIRKWRKEHAKIWNES